MPIPVTEIEVLKERMSAALLRAFHHAKNVAQIVPTIIGNVVLFADPATIRMRGNGDSPSGNMCWFTAWQSGKAYCVTYAHTSGTIEIRACNQQGETLHSFTNATTNRDVFAAFAAL